MVGSRCAWSREMALRTISPMALTYGDRDVRPLTANEVLRMVDAGILGEDEPVELLQGVLTAVSPTSPAHGTVKTRLIGWLAPVVAAGGCALRVEEPLAVPDGTSLPEPDLAVVQDDSVIGHPTAALLVVEVAVTSRSLDLEVKPALYAGASPEYWVVDVPKRCVHAFADPADGRYATRSLAREGDTLRACAVGAPPLDVTKLLTRV